MDNSYRASPSSTYANLSHPRNDLFLVAADLRARPVGPDGADSEDDEDPSMSQLEEGVEFVLDGGLRNSSSTLFHPPMLPSSLAPIVDIENKNALRSPLPHPHALPSVYDSIPLPRPSNVPQDWKPEAAPHALPSSPLVSSFSIGATMSIFRIENRPARDDPSPVRPFSPSLASQPNATASSAPIDLHSGSYHSSLKLNTQRQKLMKRIQSRKNELNNAANSKNLAPPNAVWPPPLNVSLPIHSNSHQIPRHVPSMIDTIDPKPGAMTSPSHPSTPLPHSANSSAASSRQASPLRSLIRLLHDPPPSMLSLITQSEGSPSMDDIVSIHKSVMSDAMYIKPTSAPIPYSPTGKQWSNKLSENSLRSPRILSRPTLLADVSSPSSQPASTSIPPTPTPSPVPYSTFSSSALSPTHAIVPIPPFTGLHEDNELIISQLRESISHVLQTLQEEMAKMRGEIVEREQGGQPLSHSSSFIPTKPHQDSSAPNRHHDENEESNVFQLIPSAQESDDVQQPSSSAVAETLASPSSSSEENKPYDQSDNSDAEHPPHISQPEHDSSIDGPAAIIQLVETTLSESKAQRDQLRQALAVLSQQTSQFSVEASLHFQQLQLDSLEDHVSINERLSDTRDSLLQNYRVCEDSLSTLIAELASVKMRRLGQSDHELVG